MPSGPPRDRHGPVDDHVVPTASGASRGSSGAGARSARRRPTARALVLAAASLVVAGLAGCAGTESAGTDVAPAPAPHAVTPPPSSPTPLLTTSPDEHSEVGEVVAGFPSDLLPMPEDAVVLVTSAVPLGDADVREVSLNLTTGAGVAQILDLYRASLVGAGFTEVPAPGGALAAETTFVRSGGDELVSIGVLDADGRRTVTIGGRVRTEG